MAVVSNVKMIWDFLKIRKKWWLLPILVFSLIVSWIIMSTSGTVYAPFVYTLF